MSSPQTNPQHLQQLEAWLRSYRPQELFDAGGRLLPELAALVPAGAQRMGSNPYANGGLLLQELQLPDFRDYAMTLTEPGQTGEGDTHVVARFLRDVVGLNESPHDFRIFGPDETLFSHVWRQDHNGFSHQDPGVINVVLNKKAARVPMS